MPLNCSYLDCEGGGGIESQFSDSLSQALDLLGHNVVLYFWREMSAFGEGYQGNINQNVVVMITTIHVIESGHLLNQDSLDSV